MSVYIDIEAACAAMPDDYYGWRDKKALKSIPAADVRPLVHGRLEVDELHKEAVRRSEKAGTHDIWYNCMDRVISAFDIGNAPTITIIPADEPKEVCNCDS